MKVGQEVVCIKSFEELRKIWNFNYPKVGDTVRVFSIRPHHTIDDTLITVTGLDCEVCGSNFAPVEYNIISNKEVIEETIEEKLDVPVKELI